MTLFLWLGIFFVFIVALGPRSCLEHARGLMPATSNSVKGEWVGRVDISGIRDPFHRAISKAAVIRFHLATSDYFMENYSGEGEMTIAGEDARTIHVSKLSMSDQKHGYRTGVTVVPRASDGKDPISGYYAGNWVPGTSLSIRRDDVEGYEMSGVLHKGSDADYAALVKDMQAH